MSETRPNKACRQCRAYITTYQPGVGWTCTYCGPRTPEQMGEPLPLNHRDLTVKSLAARSTLRGRLPEVETMGAREPSEERVFQLYDGATAQEHRAFMLFILDVHQLKLGEPFDGGWWIARKRTADPSFTNPYAPPAPRQIRGTDHVINI